jgi:hypothetical protein
MATRVLASPAVAVFAAALLLAGAVQLQGVREAKFPPPADDPDILYVTSGAAMKRISGAYAPLAADTYWIRAIQYYGSNKLRLARANQPVASAAPGDRYELLFPLLDLATTLDPLFNIAYRFGAVFLSEPYPSGPGRPDLAIALLEKGLRARPDKWEYLEDIGFVHYWYRHDYGAAAESFRKASEVPGAPWWLQSLAATTLAKGGDRESSRRMWEAIHQSAEVDWLRQDAERRLLQFRALDEIDALQRGVDDVARRGVAPADWASLARAGVLRAVPVDPTGVPYELAAGRVQLGAASKLNPLPTDAPAEALPR